MAYFGKVFKLEKEDNFENFMKSAGLKPDELEKYLAIKPTYKFTKTGDSYSFIESHDGETKEVTFKSGVEFDDEFEGNQAKSLVTVAGDKITYVQKFSDGTTWHAKYEFTDNKLKETLSTSSSSSTATRYYSA